MRSSCSRRRSPPDRSEIRVVSLSPVNPNRSSSCDEVSSPPRPARAAVRRIAGDVVEDRHRFVDLVEGLRQVGDPDGLALLDPAAVRRELTGQDLQERGLAGAVRPEQPDPVGRPEPERDVVEHHPVAEGQAHVLDVEHVLAEARGGQLGQRELVARRRLVLDQRVGGLDPELRLGATGGRAATQPGELLLQQVLPLRLRDLRTPGPLRLREHVGGVPTVVRRDAAALDLPRVGADRIEEPAVVGHDDERAGPVDHVLGEPVDRLDVEVVGGLVEDQQVDLDQQQPGQRGAPPLTTAQRADERLVIDATQQVLHHRPRPRVGGPRVGLHLAEHRVQHGLLRVEVVALAEVPEPQVPVVGDPSAVRLLPPGQQPQQRRFAVAVPPDHADAFTPADAEADRVEECPSPEALGNSFQVDQVRCRHIAPQGSRHRRACQDRPRADSFLARRPGPR